jgi:cytochrome c556
MVFRATAFIALLSCVSLVMAQEYRDFTAWMKSSDTSMKALNKLPAKSGETAVREAERLGAVYENMIGFWRQRSAADAVKWSEQGKAAAAQLASAAHAENATEAASALKTLAGTCRSCHEAHRVKLPDGRFAFKPPSDRRPAAAKRK